MVRILITFSLLVVFTLLLYPKLILAILLLPLVFLIPSKNRKIAKEKLDEFSGICQFAITNSDKKLKNKNKILNMFQERGELSNSDVRDALGVSSATVTRYMDDLEKDGKVVQRGDKKAAYYIKGS